MKVSLSILAFLGVVSAHKLNSHKLVNLLQDDNEADNQLLKSIRVDARDIPELAAGDSNGIYSESESAIIPQLSTKA